MPDRPASLWHWHFKTCNQHDPPPTIKWGIAAGERWCDECKKLIRLRIDLGGHP